METIGKTMAAAVLGVAATVATAVPATAATDDSFSVRTTNGCGSLTFVDYGPGAPGHGDNDDYLAIRDTCRDGKGVRGFTEQNGILAGTEYNGRGNGKTKLFDPYQDGTNVVAGDEIIITVCLVDGPSDTTAEYCDYARHVSVDG